MNIKKGLYSLLGTVLVGTTLAACSAATSTSESSDNQGSQADSDVVTISFFDKNSGSKKFDDRIAKEIEKRTGVKIDLQNPTGDYNSKLALMLSSRDYPDIVMLDRTSELVDKYIAAEALIPLNDLIDEYGPNAKEMYGDMLSKTKNSDGENYYFSNWYGPSDQPVVGWNMRYDYMVELVGKERADSPEPFTQEEMLNVMRAFKEKYATVDGKEGIPLTIAESGTDLVGMFGLKTYYEKDNELQHYSKDPRFLQMVTFMNQMYRENLLDKEWVTNNSTLKNQKLSAGNVLGSVSGYWDPQSVNDANRQAGKEDAVFVAYKVVGEGVDPSETTYSGRSSLGWDAIGITDNCENPEAATKLIDFLASREGQSLLLWGIEGEDYTVENGEYIPAEETLNKFIENRENATNETGITRWTWFVNNMGPTENTPMRITDYIDRGTFESKMAFQNLTDTYWDTSIYEDLTPDVNTPVGLKWQKINDIFEQAMPKMINAENEADVNTLYEKMLDDMEKAGLKEAEEAITKNYQERLELWQES